MNTERIEQIYEKHLERYVAAKAKCAEYRSLAEDIAAAAAADVKPIVRATWIYDERSVIGNPYGSYACPVCDNRIPHRRDFCPYCGADMRGNEDE